MMTVHEVSQLTGVSIRTLQYYDKIGLLKASARTQAGYRLYDDAALAQLQQILLFRELEFPLKEIRQILSNPDFDRARAIQQQIELLTLKKEHLEKLITLARGIQQMGGSYMDFSAFDSSRLEEYTKQARAAWGTTDAYREFEERNRKRTPEAQAQTADGLMAIFAELGQIRQSAPDCAAAQALVQRLQAYISGHYYRCTKQILRSLGQMYAAGGKFTENIDAAGGVGTAAFANAAIAAYCESDS